MSNKLIKKLFSVFLCFAFSATADAQALSSEEIENAASLMRQSGTPEEVIKQFITSAQQAQKIQKDILMLQGGETATAPSVIPADDAAAIGSLLENFAAIGAASKARQLQKEIAAFVSEHADKPDVSVFIGDRIYPMKLLTCGRKGEAFHIHLGMPPTEVGRLGASFYASRSGPYAGGDGGQVFYLESLSFNSSELKIGVANKTGFFSGSTFSFEGLSDRSSEEPQLPIRVEFSCE